MLVGAIIVQLAVVLTLGLYLLARIGDNRQRALEETIIKSAFKHVSQKLSDTIAQNAYWDAAYDHISEPIDKKWVDDRLGQYSAETAAIPITAIFNRQRHAVYRYAGRGTSVSLQALDGNWTVLDLIGKAAAAPNLPPVSSTGFVRIGSQIYLAAAERIVPNDLRARRPLSRRLVLCYLLPLDAGGLASLQTDFRVAALGWSQSPPADKAAFPVRDTRGRPIEYLTWNAARPGTAFALAAAPFAIACFLAVSILQLIVLRSWLHTSARLRDESASRTMFLANASHELRTPLNAIIGFSECLAQEMFGPLTPRYRGYAVDIHESGKLLLNLVNDVLDLTRITSEPLAAGRVELSSALAQPLRILQEYAKPESVEIRFKDASGNAAVMATEKALGQILLNLGSNAVKFSPSGGAVDIAVSTDQRANWVQLSVRDRGEGIPAEKLRLIGQPFLEVHSNSPKPGSGLGLAIVKSLAEKLGGELLVESTPGSGTTAMVRLPVCRELAAA